MMIEASHLTVKYGTLKAVDDFDFIVDRGEILALVGPDGAGKTSIFRAVCNLINFEKGEVRIAGYDHVREFDRIKPHLGYMPQAFSLYPDLSVEENMKFYAGLFGLDRHILESRMEKLYSFSGLGPFARRRAGALSGGMKQKLALSCNLVHDPEVLLLDEPTTGVDPLSRRQFWSILKDLRESGSAIVVSTPYMDEVELADRAIFIHKGRKLAEGTPRELTAMFRGYVYLVEMVPSSEYMSRLNSLDGSYARRFGSSIHLYTDDEQSADNLAERLNAIDLKPTGIKQINPELEDVFIQLMGS
nr:ABC transporter ATP-binding protein [candidate division Zixibacteria bacterium]